MSENTGSNPELPFNPDDPETLNRSAAMEQVVARFLTPEDREFMGDIDDEAELIGYVYGRLLEEGYDPDEILSDFGVTEADGEV